MSDRIPIGWFDLVHDGHNVLRCDYTKGRLIAMTADRGWLHIDVDDSALGLFDRCALGRLLQGYVTLSLHVCGGSGSEHARDRGNGRVVPCDECNEKTCDA